MTRDVGSALAAVLRDSGVHAIFGVPGGQTLPLYAACRREGPRHVLMRDERSAVCAADAYARVAGTVGVCDATVGPGATNLVSGLAEALASSVPVLAIVADISGRWEHLRRRSVASQAMEQRAFLEPCTKWVARVSEAGAFDEILSQALRVATTGRPGPVVLEIPEDVFASPAPDSARTHGIDAIRYPRFRPGPPPDLLQRAVDWLLGAERPLILAGGGVLLSGATAALSGLAAQLQIPVCTTINGKGSVAETGARALGVVGQFGSMRANRALAQADVLLVLGSKLDQLSTFNWRLPTAEQRVIQVDIDGEEIGRTGEVALGIVADIEATAPWLAALLPAAPHPAAGWADALSAEGQPGTAANDPRLAPEDVVRALDGLMRNPDVLVCDASLASGWGAQHFRVKRPGRGFLAPRGLAGLGWGAGAALGAHFASPPGTRVVCLAGDGAWTYSLAELESAVRCDADITYVILNNATLGWIRHVELRRGMEPTADFSDVDFAAAARAMGASAVRVESHGALQDALKSALETPGASLVEAITSADASPIVSLHSLRGPGGT